MSTYYDFMVEAKYEGKWYNIDFHTKDIDGKLRHQYLATISRNFIGLLEDHSVVIMQDPNLVHFFLGVVVGEIPSLIIEFRLDLLQPYFGRLVHGALIDHGQKDLGRLILQRAGMRQHDINLPVALGEVYDFNGNSCIVIGGAYSVDKYYRLARGSGRNTIAQNRVSPRSAPAILR